MPGLDRFQTVVRNTSGVKMFFACLPPHGAELDVDQDFFFKGDLLGALSAKRYGKEFDALAYAVNAGLLTIIETPVGVRFDPTLGKVSQITIDNGDVAIVDPEAGSYFGSAPSYT